MPLIAGTVTIADDGDETMTSGSLAEAIYVEFVNNFEADNDVPMPEGADGAPTKQNFAMLATRLSAALVNYLVANTAVTVTIRPADAGLQRDADGANPDTLGPSGDKIVTGVIA